MDEIERNQIFHSLIQYFPNYVSQDINSYSLKKDSIIKWDDAEIHKAK